MDHPLTDLCAICHVNPIKYTCPRCGIHTCSLPCVKKHKAWAQCSGARNPAEYRKRTDLATEASFDKDFNFISNVERSINRADDDVSNRGITMAPAQLDKHKITKPKIELEIEARGINVVRAPQGLSRSKLNRSHWATKHKAIMWTIEWILQDGEKIVDQAVESRSIGDAYIKSVGTKKITRKRKRPLSNHGKTSTTTGDNFPEQVSTTDTATHSELEQQTPVPTLLGGLYFYLHKPDVPAKYKCLIPLEHDQLVSTAINGQTLLEFPTIYVLDETPESLPKPFITQAEFSTHHSTDVGTSLGSHLQSGVRARDEEPSSSQPEPDIKIDKVAEVLIQDLGE